MNAVMNLWVTFSGRALPSVVSAGNIASVSAYLPSRSCVSASQSGLDTFFLRSQKVLKYVDTNVIEFQSRRRNILMKVCANISSYILKCLYCVSQLLLHDPSDLDNHFDFMNFVSADFLF